MNAVSGSGISSMSDSWIEAHPRIELASNPNPSLKELFLELTDGITDVLPDSGDVNEPKIEDLRALLLRKFQYAFCVHSLSLGDGFDG
jgi:hypothetical protein